MSWRDRFIKRDDFIDWIVQLINNKSLSKFSQDSESVTLGWVFKYRDEEYTIDRKFFDEFIKPKTKL